MAAAFIVVGGRRYRLTDSRNQLDNLYLGGIMPSERTVVVNNITLTESQIREAVKTLDAPSPPPLKYGDTVRHPIYGACVVIGTGASDARRRGGWTCLHPILTIALDRQWRGVVVPIDPDQVTRL